MARLSLERVAFGRTLASVSLTVASGEIAAVWAPERGTRSALLQVAAGIEPPESGTVLAQGRVVFAQVSWPPIGGTSVLGQLMLPLLATKRSIARARSAALDSLDAWGVEQWSAMDLGELEEHELVRLSLIRALLASPEILLVEDPTGIGGDSTAVLNLLQAARKTAAVLVATASVDAMRDADGLYTISQGILRGLRRQSGVVVPLVRRGVR